MTALAAGGLSLKTALKLGRVSNLPTVWTNALAAIVIAGAAEAALSASFLVLLIALSLFYVAGMYLNDAFDAEIDARERANRPIPMGEARRETVFALGFGMMGAAAALGFALGMAAGVAGLALGAAILVYDVTHKKTTLSPVSMGLCRMAVYAMSALAVGAELDAALWTGAFGLFAYVVGLTYAAKQEAYDRIGAVWPLAVLAVPLAIPFVIAGSLGAAAATLAFWVALAAWMLVALRLLFRRAKSDVPKAVVSLIAGMSLYDAALIAAAGAPVLALLAVLGFGATLALQRLAPGT